MSFLQKLRFECMDHSPELLLGVGIAGAIVTVVSACKATLKVNEILEEHKADLETIDETAANEEIVEYTAEDAKRDKIIRYRDTAIQFVKLYAPAIILGTLSVGCMVKSNDILNKRNLSLAAAYTLMSDAYSTYRKRVVDKFGEEIDRQLQLGTSEIEYTETDENGEFKKPEKVEVATNPLGFSRYITPMNPDYDENEEFMESFLRAQFNFFENKKKTRGWIMLNEMLDHVNLKEDPKLITVGYTKFDDIDIRVKSTKILNEVGELEKVYLVEFFGLQNVQTRMRECM